MSEKNRGKHPNDDKLFGEKWKPILGVWEIILSVICVLYEPNLDSPANIDAAKLLRENPKEYKKKIFKLFN